MHGAYLRATEQDEVSKLKQELHALQTRYDRVLIMLQDSIDAILRVAREGKTES